MKNLEKRISVKENKESSEKSLNEKLDNLKLTLETRDSQSEFAKEMSGVNLEKINYLARIDDVSEILEKTNKSDGLKSLAFDKLGIA